MKFNSNSRGGCNPFIILSWITILATFALLCLCAFWLIYPYRTIEYSNIPFPVLNENKTVVAGNELVFQVEMIRYTDAVTFATRGLVGDFNYTLESQVIKTPRGYNSMIACCLIPQEVESGKYKYISVVSWRVNPLRTITKVTETEEFSVVKGK
jgi:hypothetical protein